jgi:glycosyltransferase involved in cell wall biosynthesis
MKILIYTHPFAPIVGGAESYVMFLAQGLSVLSDPASLEIAVTTPTPAGDFDDSQLTFPVIRKPSLLALVSLVKNADVVQLVGPCLLPLFIAWVLGKSIVIEHHGYPPVCPNGLLFYEPTKTVCPGHFHARNYGHCLRCNAANEGWFNSLKMLFLTFPRRWLCQQVAANTPITLHVQNRLKLPRSRVIYYGIPDISTDSQLHSICPSSGSPLCFAYVGRLVSLKGLHLILEAAKNLQMAGYKFRLKFVGDGPDRGKLESQAEKLGLAKYVEFTGFTIGPAFQSAIKDVAAVLMPSVWEETAGLAAIEQMMRGKLVIASDIGGLGEVVDGCGLRFPAGSAESLAACMRAVLDHPEIVEQNGKAARRRALDIFSLQRMVREHFELYCKLTPSVDRSPQAEHLGSS